MKERIDENHPWVTDDGFFLICGDEITDSASKGNIDFANFGQFVCLVSADLSG